MIYVTIVTKAVIHVNMITVFDAGRTVNGPDIEPVKPPARQAADDGHDEPPFGWRADHGAARR